MADDAGRFSSPDPLAEDDLDLALPSSMMTTKTRPTTATRRARTSTATATLLPYDRSDGPSMPANSTPVKGSGSATSAGGRRRRWSPRKRTFELDVGDGRSPQRIYVTVEAGSGEEAAKRGVKRKLFPPSSPSRTAVIHGEEITTTSVPLRGLTDDEGGGEGAGAEENGNDDGATPRKRPRRRKSNGTPMPGRGRKRAAGTPLQKTATTNTQRRGKRKGDAPTGVDDVENENGHENENADAGATPKPTTRARKTPKKPAAPEAPSSQLSSRPTGRKRGRPRKALLPDELPLLTESEADRTAAVTDQMERIHEPPSDAVPPSEANVEEPRDDADGRGEGRGEEEDLLMLDSTPRRSNGTPTPESIRRQLEGRATSPDPTSEDAYADVDEGYMPMMENQSDAESEFEGAGGGTYNGQDTLAHASDFSMIAVESLPSFQASFQADLSRANSERAAPREEFGKETSLIINQTLASLRQSTQTEAERHSAGPLSADDNHRKQDQPERPRQPPEELTRNSSQGPSRSPSQSPRKQKPLPLSRQLFGPKVAKAPHVDDSFSTVPDSILHAATPRRVPMRATSTAAANESTSMYDDSFSEIPEAVLEAATPKPPARTTAVDGDDAPAADNTMESSIHSVGRSGRSTLRSTRLPTPDDTSSSNNGSKRALDEEGSASAEVQEGEGSNARPDITSSPPNQSQFYVTDFDAHEIQRDTSGTPNARKSSPHLPSSGAAPLDRVQSLEPPIHGGRPSLSPIVRVARTLQSVISDRSSPDGRESNLGSPLFRRSSASNEPARQSPGAAKSPTPVPPFNISNDNNDDGDEAMGAPTSSFDAFASFKQRWRSSQNRNNQHQPSPSVIGEVDDPFGPGIRADVGNADGSATATNSMRAAPPSDDQMGLAADRSPAAQRAGRQPGFSQVESQSSSLLGTRRSRASQAMGEFGVENGDENFDGGGPNSVGEEPGHSEVYDQTPGQDGEDSGITYNEDDDDMDIWDIEASRPTPDQPSHTAQVVPEPRTQHPQLQQQQQQQASSSAEEPPHPRRSKIPSPWRRNGRRLIYKDEVTSPSQIEIEEASPVSGEADDDGHEMIPAPAPAPASRRTSAIHQWRGALDLEPEQEPEQEQEPGRDTQPRTEVREDTRRQTEIRQDATEEHDMQEAEVDDYDLMDHQSDDGSVAAEQAYHNPESETHSMVEQLPENGNGHSSERQSAADEEYSLLLPSDKTDAEPAPQENSTETTQVEEYSLVAQQGKNNKNQGPAQEKRKSRFFGGFDILSFFSSPAALPKTGDGAGGAETPSAPRVAAMTKATTSGITARGAANTTTTANTARESQATREREKAAQPAPVEETPNAALWSNGLFPSIPQKQFRPSPERRVDLFSSPRREDVAADAGVSGSSDPVVDTYAPSLSGSGSDSGSPERSASRSPTRSPVQSAAPSTPDRQIYPPIGQKLNPPRGGQQSGPSSLFSAQPAAATAGRNATAAANSANGFLRVPQLPQLQRLEDGGQEEQGEGHDSSVLTDGTDYERLPPRDKPSQWDRTASPSKSCFRSPLKPTPPGRVVAFTSSALSPLVARRDDADNRGSGSRPAPQPRGKDNVRSSESAWVVDANTTNRKAPSAPVDGGRGCGAALPASTSGRQAQQKQLAYTTAQAYHSTDSATTRTTASPTSTTSDTTSPEAPTTTCTFRPPLSQTTWTKDHWLRLEFLAHLRRRDPVAFDPLLPPELDLSFFERHRLRGKEVAAQGARLLLDPWHLEVVEAFRRELGGDACSWDDASLAKRLFALLVAEERRARKRDGGGGGVAA
ncbi:hypothetical protein DL764_009669 [Monosporascus ibericus]|uniref:Uncharacterized protein n=1 Tax=Monosporascus ibericus TaxID=155417 RepID=A0A4V1X8X1_9PEZI|nr:hypothetical protein DL764_009669 [Monosporascus ibericus]